MNIPVQQPCGPVGPPRLPSAHRVPDGALRHLAVAAGELALGPGLAPEEAARYAGAEARFRALAAPEVPIAAGRSVRLTDLVGGPWVRRTRRLVAPHVDRELVDQAKDLLRGLAWGLPARGRP